MNIRKVDWNQTSIHLVANNFCWMLLRNCMSSVLTRLLLLRLSSEPTILEIVKKEIIGCLWDDVKLRIKVLSKVDPACSLKKRETLSLCYGLLITSFLEYDEGILSDDKTLAGALWRNIYDRELDNPIPLNALVRYVRSQKLAELSVTCSNRVCVCVRLMILNESYFHLKFDFFIMMVVNGLRNSGSVINVNFILISSISLIRILVMLGFVVFLVKIVNYLLRDNLCFLSCMSFVVTLTYVIGYIPDSG
ncbi:ubiquinol-cytochrome c reductase complex chaperone CBP3-like protein [Trichinella spiralis]|uniref:ubiquinol-cytochrome c reductase complex chaperone CBP3-like protein n=1 Tax=Trichinella spiralis TaxID=6334 RepID=UPI0001EFCBBD|nr:ubiquinol-cytochrome c reductase complex chaperone CBP3-like protein [Trichinella spiralis]